ncbi:hypothetical protein ACLMJK_000658 [Lecanora helva]
MAKSIDDLIHHLLDQISLYGDRGALPCDFIYHVKDFYAHSSAANVDRPFLEQVWKWLIRNPEVRLGHHAAQRSLSLAKVEAHNATRAASIASDPAVQELTESGDVGLPQDGNSIVRTGSAEPSETPRSHPVDGASGTADDVIAASPVDLGEHVQVPEAHESKECSRNPVTDKNAPESNDERDKPQKAGGIASSKSDIRLYASENRMWHALAGHGPDPGKIKALDFACLSMIGARGPRGIAQHELVKASGQDKRSLPARTDRLHSDGYIEKTPINFQQEQPKKIIRTSHLVLKRFVREGLVTSVKGERASASAGTVLQGSAEKDEGASKEITGQSPQWTPHRSLSNQVFDLVAQSGTDGLTMRDIRQQLFREYVRKPVDEHVMRLVECWQLSQPLHLRHLAIIRDTKLRGKTSVYTYYTYDNFQKLVDEERGFWDAVKAVPDGTKVRSNTAAPLDAKAELDDYGFPILDPDLFEGDENDAAPEECVFALKTDRFRVSGHEPVLAQQADGSYVIKYKRPQHHLSTKEKVRRSKDVEHPHTRCIPAGTIPDGIVIASSSSQLHQSDKSTAPLSSPTPKRSSNLIVRTKGRPRKWPTNGVNTDADLNDPDIQQKLRHSQDAAEKYVRNKLEKEIKDRIARGNDAKSITLEVLTEAEAQRKEDGQQPIPEYSRELILHKFADGPKPKPRVRAPIPNTKQKTSKGRKRPRGSKSGALPSSSRKKPRTATQCQSDEVLYISSLAAHCCPTGTCDALRASALEGNTSNECLGRGLYLPSTFAHTGLSLHSLNPNAAHSKPKAISDITVSLQQTSSPANMHPYSESHDVQSAVSLSDQTPNNDSGAPTYNWMKNLSKFCEREVARILRPHDGVFLAKTKRRWRRPGEPLNSPRSYKLAIFKSVRLKGLKWINSAGEHLGHVQSTSQKQNSIIPTEASPQPILVTDLPTNPPNSSSNSPAVPPTDTSSRCLLSNSVPESGRRREPSDGLNNLQSSTPPPSFTEEIREANDLASMTTSPQKAVESSHLFVEKSKAGNEEVVASTTESSDDTAERHSPSSTTAAHQVEYRDATRHRESDSLGERKAPLSTNGHISLPDAREEYPGEIPGVSSREERPFSPQISSSQAFVPSDAADEQQMGSSGVASAHERGPSPADLCKEVSPQVTTSPRVSADQNQSHQGSTHQGLNNSTPPAITLKEGHQEISSETPQPSAPSRKRKRSSSGKESFALMSRRGGSVAALRKKVVMDIMEKCGGIFAGHREMSRPFAVEWKKRGQEGTPEEKTVLNTVNSLCTEGKLCQTTFAFQTKQGKNVTKSLLTYPGISDFDPRLKDLKLNIMAYYPNFFPGILGLTEEYANTDEQNSGSKTGRYANASQNIISGKHNRAEATLAMMKAQEQAHKEHFDQPTGGIEIQRGDVDGAPNMDAASTPIRRVPNVEYMPPSHSIRSTSIKRPRGGRAEGSSSAKRPRQARPLQASLPQDTGESTASSNTLLWLPESFAFETYNYEEDRPTIVEPAVHQDTHQRHARYGNLLSPRKPRRESIDQFSDEADERSENYDRAKAPHRRRKRTRFLLPKPPVSPPPSDSSEGEESDVDLSSSPGAEDENLDHAQTSPSPGLLPTAPTSRSKATKKLVESFMDAIHYFHQPSGTFSVDFCGIRPPRKVYNLVGTCSKPYSVGPRKVNSEFPAPRGPRSILPRRPFDAADTQFEQEVDAALDWELETADLESTSFSGLPFVNHSFNHAHITAGDVEAKVDAMKETLISKNSRMFSRKIPSLSEIGAKTGRDKPELKTKSISAAAAEALRKIRIRAPPKKRRLTSLAEQSTLNGTSTALQRDDGGRPTKIQRTRAPRGDDSLGPEGEIRLQAAVTVVRVLAGGLDKDINWDLVAKVFEPDYSKALINRRWKYLLKKYRPNSSKMEETFQNLYINAYKEGSVPSINYDHLEDYDWKGITDWALSKFDSEGKTQIELPTDRAYFDELYEMEESSDIDVSDYYGINGTQQTLASREKLINRKAFVMPAVLRQQSSPAPAQTQLDVVKTLIRANVITPEETYNPSLARAKLSTIPEDMINEALNKLLADKVLTQENKGRLVPGRNYDVSQQFISRLKKNILPEHFHQALAYKNHLDATFRTGSCMPYNPNCTDGEQLAVTNLLACHRIRSVRINTPMNKWGHTDGSYEIRLMDKSRLNFEMELHPTDTYVYDNPLPLPLPDPPCSSQGDDPPLSTMQKIPLWFDIHNSFVPVMWDMVLAAVLAVLCVRPGINAQEISKCTRPAAEAWELDLMLGWLVQAGAAKRWGGGFLLEEWFWLCFSGGGGGWGWDKGKGKERER